MQAIRERLATGQRWWAAEAVLRAGGLAMLAAAALLARLLARSVAAHPHAGASVVEFLACLAAFVLLTVGLALAAIGPRLFRRIPLPPRALLA